MIDALKRFREERPLAFVLMCALFVRLLAVFFAKGFMMHDDHFLTIEPSASWAAGANFNDWLPGIGNTRPVPEPISFFYLFFLYGIFKGLHAVGIDNPDTQMYFMRALHAFYSLMTVLLVYRITELLSDRKRAFLAGILMAFIGVLPNFSVRNLVELVCMPPLLYGMYLLILHSNYASTGRLSGLALKHLLAAAFVMGLAVGVRYQTGLFVALTGVVLFLHTGLRNFVLFGATSFAAFFLTQIDDVILWGGKPFQHLLGYFGYNTENAFNYPGSPFAYLSFVGYFILPPVSLFLVYGFWRKWKQHLLIVLPVTGFLLFHIVYPNKQERFILPALPFVVAIGVIGWSEFVSKSKWWNTRQQLHRNAWRFFWVLNTVGMLVLCFTYSKKSRVEAMVFLHEQGDCVNFIQEKSISAGPSQVPQYYWGKWAHYYAYNQDQDLHELITSFPEKEQKYAGSLSPHPLPNYVLFYNDENLTERIARMKSYYPNLKYQITIHPGWFDEMLFRLNPLNTRETVHVYKVMED